MTQKNDELKKHSDTSEANTATSTFNRRQFLGAGVATAAAFVLPRPAKANAVSLPWDIPSTTITASSINGFPQPDFIANPATLTVTSENIQISDIPGDGGPGQVRAYNGGLPGPTFKVRAGEQLEIELVNDLPPNSSTPQPPDTGCPGTDNKPRCLNTTNLHFHGFHVSPLSLNADNEPVSGGDAVLSSDDVLYELAPRESDGDAATRHDYCVWLPDFHAPGTHWYHSHKHGSTAIQIIDGMAGALIVEEEGEYAIDVNEDVLWIMQEIIGQNDTDVYNCVNTSQGFVINGEYQPTLTMQPGELQRWRFLNATATPRGFMTLKFQKKGGDDIANDGVYGSYLIAVDGISFYGKSPEATSELPLSPANRADFLVRLEEGEYEVYKNAFSGVNAAGTPQLLATVNVTGTPIEDGDAEWKDIPDLIPGTAPDYLQPIAEINNTRDISFDTSGAGCGGGSGPIPKVFEINNQPYVPDGPNETVQVVQINTAEEWTLTNTTGSYHPFHIHVNPFQVVEISGDSASRPPVDPDKWWDTFYIPANGSIKIRQRYSSYYGKFVFHCHILIHEDLGMMQNVLVEGEGTGPCESLS